VGINFNFMDGVGLVEQVGPTPMRPVADIGSAPDEPLNAGKKHGTCTHRAGFKRRIEGGPREAPIPKSFAPRSQTEEFRMGRGVLERFDAVVRSSDNLSFKN
jgi:hypothetical protein